MLIAQNNNNNNNNNPEPFFGKLKGIRFAAASEPPNNASVNDSILKLISSQEQLDYRNLFSNVINKLGLNISILDNTGKLGMYNLGIKNT
jgi:hypothetical protein